MCSRLCALEVSNEMSLHEVMQFTFVHRKCKMFSCNQRAEINVLAI